VGDIVLRTNAVAVYGFLSAIAAEQPDGKVPAAAKILDCGAGGPVPPLALFEQHGFEAWGVDTRQSQLDLANQYCRERGIKLQLRKGDMRRIPFDDGAFDYVYEHYSMCHLGKSDTRLAVSEMRRVLKAGGLCFLGVISSDTWPRSLLGEEESPGEFWKRESGSEPVLHTLFTDGEAATLVADWEIVSQERHVRYVREAAAAMSIDSWMELYPGSTSDATRQDWRARYANRVGEVRSAYLFFILRKPGEPGPTGRPGAA
jgi:SAM-dependent methyltransferase